MIFNPAKLKQYRYDRSLTLQELSARSGVSWQAIQKYEAKKSRPKSGEIVRRLASALRCRVEDLCDEENEILMKQTSDVEVAKDSGRWLRLPICAMAQAAQIGTEAFPLANCLADPEADSVAFSLAKPGDTIVRVRGKSALPWFPAGTLLLVRFSQNLRNGDLVVAVLEGGEVVFKIFVATEKRIALLPIDPAIDNARFEFDRSTMPDEIRFYRVIQSMRNERALSDAMTAAGIAHGWEKELAKLKGEKK